MKFLLKTIAYSVLIITGLTLMSLSTPAVKKSKNIQPKNINPKIQVAILLDVSNSMDGLIEQAKAQLWNMVSVMGKAKCDNNVIPQIEIALYEYGRSTNAVTDGYVKQISGFTTDLDKLSGQVLTVPVKEEVALFTETTFPPAPAIIDCAVSVELAPSQIGEGLAATTQAGRFRRYRDRGLDVLEALGDDRPGIGHRVA